MGCMTQYVSYHLYDATTLQLCKTTFLLISDTILQVVHGAAIHQTRNSFHYIGFHHFHSLLPGIYL